jgi:hypothetical protein
MTDGPYDPNNPANINIPEESALSKKEREAKEDDSDENYYAQEIAKNKVVMQGMSWYENRIRKKITALSSKQFNRKGPENRFY